MQLTGKVTEMRWANPHAWIYIDVEGPDGAVVNWALEMSGANGLIRRGWRKEDLPAGTVLQVDGWQARNGSPTANISTVTFGRPYSVRRLQSRGRPSRNRRCGVVSGYA